MYITLAAWPRAGIKSDRSFSPPSFRSRARPPQALRPLRTPRCAVGAARATVRAVTSRLTHTHTHTLSLSLSLSLSLPAGGRAINNRQSASPYSPASHLPSLSNSRADSTSAIQNPSHCKFLSRAFQSNTGLFLALADVVVPDPPMHTTTTSFTCNTVTPPASSLRKSVSTRPSLTVVLPPTTWLW